MFDDAYAHRNFPQIHPEWLAKHQEPVIDPGQKIIDPHHHLWEVPGCHYLVPELVADLKDGHDIRATVHIDCKSGYRTAGPEELRPVGETEFVMRCAAEAEKAGTRGCAAMIGYADCMLGAPVRAVLEAHLAAGGSRFRGIRVRAAWHPDPAFEGPHDGPPPDMMQRPEFRAGFAELARLGLVCDLWVFHTQLEEAADLIGAFPDTPFVLNHCGGPLGIGPYAGKRDAVFPEWRRGIGAVARHPNAMVKLGGLAMKRIGFAFDERDAPPDSATLATAWQPYIDACLDAFTPRRAMFESNFPVDKGMTSYRVLWNAFKRMTQHLTPAERDAVFHDNAASFYGIAA